MKKKEYEINDYAGDIEMKEVADYTLQKHVSLSAKEKAILRYMKKLKDDISMCEGQLRILEKRTIWDLILW